MVGDLDLALTLGQRAAARALSMASGRSRSWTKADGTPVTEADLVIEQDMVATLHAERPCDGVLAEETGGRDVDGRRWLLDPIDGTSSFIDGGRGWGTHVALNDHDRIVVAVVTRPTEGRCWWACAGSGAYAGDLADPLGTARPLHVSQVADLRQARVGGLVPSDSTAEAVLREVATWVEDDISIMAAFLEGRVDAVVDEGGDPWDLAPCTLLAAEAGGRFRDPTGGTRFDRGGGLYSNAPLHDELTVLLAANLAGGRKE